MVKSKSKIIRFLNKYVFKNMLICMLCVSSVIGLTACCYPSAITRSATDKGSGYSELDYLNSMFSGAMVLTSLTADELTSDYLFYEEEARGDDAEDKLNSYFNIADRQFTTMAQYIERMCTAMYGSFDAEGNFLGWSWDKKFDVMYPHWWKNDPNCVYSNNIEAYYNTALLSTPKQPANNSNFAISHTNELFHYACSEMEGCNYKFSNERLIDARLHIYENKTDKSSYQSNTSDTSGKIQIAPIWIPDEGTYHYYVVSNERTQDAFPQSKDTPAHFYDVLNANANVLNKGQNSTNKTFLFWKYDDSYQFDPVEDQGWTCASAQAIAYSESAPNIHDISWDPSAQKYKYTYGFQTGNGRVVNTSGKESDDCDVIRKVSWYNTWGGTRTYWLGKGKSEPVAEVFGIDIGESYNYGSLYDSQSDAENGRNPIGKYVQGWFNSYFEVYNQYTVNDIQLKYFEFNGAFFPVDDNIRAVYGSVNDVIHGRTSRNPIFTSSSSIPYYEKRDGNAYLVVQIGHTEDITAVFDHNRYFNDYAGKTSRNTITAWENNGDFKPKKIKYALAAINRYGTYQAVKTAYGGDFSKCLSKKQYKLNIANGKSIGLSQALYDGIISYMRYYIIGDGDYDFFSGMSGYNTYNGDWLWQASKDAKRTYLGDNGTEPYAEIFAANNNKAKLSLYKAYDFIIPRIIGSCFSLVNQSINQSNGYPHSLNRMAICSKLEQGKFDTNLDEFDPAKTLFPSLVASRIYTYGNISTLNRLYNYEMGIDYGPHVVEETDSKKDFENYEGYQDKIGRYLYLYPKDGGSDAYKNNPGSPAVKVEKTLAEFLYGRGTKEDVDYTTKSTSYTYEGTEYYCPPHKGVLDVVTEAKMQSLILFPKVTKDPDPNNPSTKPDNEYGEYICVDPTFITSMIGKYGEGYKDGPTNTYIRMSVEIAGAYTSQTDSDGNLTVSPVSGTNSNNHKVGSYGQSYNHSGARTKIDDKGNFTSNQVTQFLHVYGDEFYTDLAVMQQDKDGNIIRVSDDNNIPRYYFKDQVNKYGEYNGTPLTGEEPYVIENDELPSDVKKFVNYSREVYIYTDDYLYFKSNVNSGFSLYKYSGYGNKVINDQYFYAGHTDKIWTGPFSNIRVKYDSYKIRTNLFQPLIDGFSLNTAVVGSYIKIDYSYYGREENGELLDPQNDVAYTDANKEGSSDAKEVGGDDAGDTTQTASGSGAQLTTQYSTDDSTRETVKINDADKYGFYLSDQEVNFYLFETGIYAVDCGTDLMAKQDSSDFPVDMVGDYVVEFIEASSKQNLISIGVNDGHSLSESTPFNNLFNASGGKLRNGSWKIGDSYYKAVSYYMAGQSESQAKSIDSLKSEVITSDKTIYINLEQVKVSLTYDYTQLFKDYNDFLPTRIKSLPVAKQKIVDDDFFKGDNIVPSLAMLDIGSAIKIVGWKVYTGTSTSMDSQIDTETPIMMLASYRIVPVVENEQYIVSFDPNGGKFSKDDSTDPLEYYVDAGKNLSSNSSINSMTGFPSVYHPEEMTLLGWSITGFEKDINNNFTFVKNYKMDYHNITFYAVWDVSTVNVQYDYLSSSSMYYSGSDDIFSKFATTYTFPGASTSSSINAGDALASYDQAYMSNKLSEARNAIPHSSAKEFMYYGTTRYKYMGMTPKTLSYSKLTANRDSAGIYVYYNNASIAYTDYYSSNKIINPSNNTGLNLSSYMTEINDQYYINLRAVYQKMCKVVFKGQTAAETYVFYVAAGAKLSAGSDFVVATNIALSSMTGDKARWSKTEKSASQYTTSDIFDFNTLKDTIVTSDVTYYQIKDNISITYYNRSLGVHTTQSYLAGETITSLPALSGSAGWSTSSTSENLKDPATYINNTAGTYNFYAWYSFDVVYHYNGTTHTETVSGSNIPTGHSATNVVGWSSTQNGTSPVNLSTYRNSNVTVHLYAIYEYTATFTWHGGSTSQTLKTSYAVDSVSFTLPPSPADYTDGDKKYTFDYWSYNGSKVTSTSFNSDVTIVAIYKEVVESPTT